jgi:hypothetical protein
MAKLILQPPQRQAHSRLRDMQPHCRPADAAFVNDGQERAQEVPVESVANQRGIKGGGFHGDEYEFNLYKR